MKDDQPKAAPKTSNQECLAGLHSWIDAVGKLPPTTRCEQCGELYGEPD